MNDFIKICEERAKFGNKFGDFDCKDVLKSAHIWPAGQASNWWPWLF